MKKFIVIAFMALAVTMIAGRSFKVLAEDVTPTATPTPAPRVTSLVPPGNGSGGRINIGSIFDYYNNVLTADQRQIADYLIGMYNYMYISARGFTYNNLSITADLINRLRSFGNRFWGTTLEGNASRLDAYMQQFMSAVISYAGTIDTDFNTWVNSISGTNIVIPFTKDSLNSWTNYYNDPTALGVENWGSYENDWVSGSFYDYAFTNYGFYGSTGEDYQQYMLNYSPVLYTSFIPDTYDPNYGAQYIISLKDVNKFDSLYVLRSSTNSYNAYRFGYQNGVTDKILYYNGVAYTDSRWPGKVYFYTENPQSNCYLDGSIQYVQSLSLYDIIQYAFYNFPVKRYNSPLRSYGFYPYITHVYLVDDLNTLSNKEELSNIDDLDINSSNAIWITEPNDDDLYWQIEPTLIQGDEWDDNLVHIDLTPISEGDLTKNIVNNTVINNYNIVAPGSVINVPVDWLDSDGNYLDYTNTTAFPFFVMIGDIFNALGEIRIFIIAVLILGLAGGVLVKFLL